MHVCIYHRICIYIPVFGVGFGGVVRHKPPPGGQHVLTVVHLIDINDETVCFFVHIYIYTCKLTFIKIARPRVTRVIERSSPSVPPLRRCA